jgi:poly-gamma-glutamate capsule biosynthesis protein CapA/YwtB (metallophosphatase superfamily)
MGAAPALPPADGRHLFDGVRGQLRGDVVLANLDQALTDSTVGSKCTADSTDCFALRTPPSYAGRLREAGITVANMANNHSRDFGEQGLRDTRAALETAGVATTGLPGQVTVQRAGPLRVAVLGFAPYGWTQSLLDLGAAQELVRQAGTRADVVLVTIHAGGEGADRTHVRPGTETFLGEDRGDPMAFSRAVIDAGADAVLGAGPHVLRGMEWYRGRLIAYSLGNFVGPEVLNTRGPGGVSAVLTIELAPDGGWRGGRLTPIRLVAGLPRVDPDGRGLDAVRELSREDLGTCAVEVGADGTLGGPAC